MNGKWKQGFGNCRFVIREAHVNQAGVANGNTVRQHKFKKMSLTMSRAIDRLFKAKGLREVDKVIGEAGN